MNIFKFIFEVAGTAALLLWGVHMVQTGLERAFGSKLRHFLVETLRSRLKAFLAGIGVTAVLQSSTATALMVTGFAAGGLMELAPGLSVMLGANVGTTLIVQVLSFDVFAVAPALTLMGVILFRRARAGTRDFGRVLIGLSLILMALYQLLHIVGPYEHSPSIEIVLDAISGQPISALVLAAGVAWAAHSSAAIVLMIMSLAVHGIVPPQTAFAMVMGANLGTALNPVLEGTNRANPATRRVPIGNLLNRVAGVALALMLLPAITAWLLAVEPNAGRAVADFHTAFNLLTALLFLPILTPFSKFLCYWLPAQVDAADPGLPLYLNPLKHENPTVALGGAAREALRMADVVESMLVGVREAFEKANRRQISEVRRMDDVLDKINIAIKTYVTSLEMSEMSERDHERLREVLIFATNMEHAGDVIDRNLLGIGSKMLKRGVTFSKPGQEELLGMIERLIINARTSASLFMTGDRRTARLLAIEKEKFRELEAAATNAHFQRLREAHLDTVETTSLHLDAIRDLKNINANLVSAAAYPVLERGGELLRSRLRA